MKPAQLPSLLAKFFVLAILPNSSLSVAIQNAITFADALKSGSGLLSSTVWPTLLDHRFC